VAEIELEGREKLSEEARSEGGEESSEVAGGESLVEGVGERREPDLEGAPERDAESLVEKKVEGVWVRSYVALGSSSTAGVGASQPAKTGYVALLAVRLQQRFAGLQLLNLGRGGAQTDTYLGQLTQIKAAQPQLMTLLPFTDYARTPLAEFEKKFGQLLDSLGQLQATVFFGDLQIDPQLVCGVGKGPTGLCYDRADKKMLDAKNKAMVRLSQTRPFVRLVTIFDQNAAHPEWIAADKAHLNDRGHQYLADRFWKVVVAWLGS